MVVGPLEISNALNLDPGRDRCRSGILGGCPRCEEPWGKLTPVHAATLGEGTVRRCHRCGTRVFRIGTEERFVFSCKECGLPFLSDRLLPHSEHRCPDCRAGRPVENFPDESLAEAMEREVCRALAACWRFVTEPTLDAYLQRLVQRIADCIEAAPAHCRVVLVEDRSLRTLALPSGLLLISIGTLAFLRDEAELVFVLGHEMAHAASGEAAVRLVRLGYHAAASESEGEAEDVWTEAALDLVRLGYGRKRERDADEAALSAVVSLGYDPASVLHYLERTPRRRPGSTGSCFAGRRPGRSSPETCGLSPSTRCWPRGCPGRRTRPAAERVSGGRWRRSS